MNELIIIVFLLAELFLLILISHEHPLL